MLYVFIKDRIMHGAKILDRCGFFPAIRTEVLIEKSSISISRNKIQKHDLLQEMGREKLFGSWLWIYEDAIMY
jgi:hypothetical protein